MPYNHDQPIYLIDQDDVVRDSLKVLLESHGLRVLDFRDAGEFLRTGRAADGGCLVLGFNRNIVAGLDLVQTVRKLDRNLPAIFIVGGGGPLTKASVYAAGGFAYLERPIQEAALIRAINDALAIRSRGLTIVGASSAPVVAPSS